MKISPNYEDRNRIKEMVAKGMAAEEISQRLRIKLDGIQRHLGTADIDCPAEPELSPQQRGALTRKQNAAARAEAAAAESAAAEAEIAAADEAELDAAAEAAEIDPPVE